MLNTESTYDWANHQWTIPINLDVAQLLRIGKLPVQFELGRRYHGEGPSGGQEWEFNSPSPFSFLNNRGININRYQHLGQ
jgi:hypothetical protein